MNYANNNILWHFLTAIILHGTRNSSLADVKMYVLLYSSCSVLFWIWGQFLSDKSPGAYIWRGNLPEGFLRYEFGGLIFGTAYTWRGLFSEFYDIASSPKYGKRQLIMLN